MRLTWNRKKKREKKGEIEGQNERRKSAPLSSFRRFLYVAALVVPDTHTHIHAMYTPYVSLWKKGGEKTADRRAHTQDSTVCRTTGTLFIPALTWTDNLLHIPNVIIETVEIAVYARLPLSTDR